MPITSIRTRAAIAATATALAVLTAAAPARGGSYGVAICNPDLRAWHQDAAFSRTSAHYGHAVDCGGGGEGLSVTSDAQPTRAGAWGAWTVRAPAGTAISRLSVSAAGRASGGHVPELLTGAPGGPLAPAGSSGDLAGPALRPGRSRRGFAAGGPPAAIAAAAPRCA